MKKTILLFAILIGLSGGALSQTTKAENTITNSQLISRATLDIEGMACQEGCADKISSNLKNTSGVTAAEVSYEDKKAIISFDPSIISMEDIKSVITATKVKDYVYTIRKVTIRE